MLGSIARRAAAATTRGRVRATTRRARGDATAVWSRSGDGMNGMISRAIARDAGRRRDARAMVTDAPCARVCFFRAIDGDAGDASVFGGERDG